MSDSTRNPTNNQHQQQNHDPHHLSVLHLETTSSSSSHHHHHHNPRSVLISPNRASMTVMISPSGTTKRKSDINDDHLGKSSGTANACVLCACGGSSLLTQGGLHSFKSTKHFNTNNLTNLKNFLLLNPGSSPSSSSSPLTDLNSKNAKNKSNVMLKIGFKSVPQQLLDEFNKVGWQMESLKTSDMFDLNSDSFYVHLNCFLWSTGVVFDKQTNLPMNIDKLTFESLTRKCSICAFYGASIKCALPECQETYHYPCALLLNGSFLFHKTHKILCSQHSNQAANLFDADELDSLKCGVCGTHDRLLEEVACTSCGTCYHASCLWPEDKWPRMTNSLVRLGWQCPECKRCPACKKSDDDAHLLVCDKCDRCFHSYCCPKSVAASNDPSRPWRCEMCQHEVDLAKACASCKTLIVPLNPSQTMCNNCVAAANNEKKIVRSQTVTSAATTTTAIHHPSDITTTKKRSVKDLLQLFRSNSVENTHAFLHDQSSLSQDSDALQVKKEDFSKSLDSNSTANNNGVLSTKQPNITSKKKQMSKKMPNRGRGKRSSGNDLNSNVSTRSTRSKMSQSSGNGNGKDGNKSDAAGNSNRRVNNCEFGEDSNEAAEKNDENDEPTIGHVKRDEDDHHAVTVIASLNDSFSLKQDMCLNCGSFGRLEEGQLISCSQCGQCFHTYCAGIPNVGNVVKERGWRCLDCTVCEGCGKATDEGRLLLCDDCDISYHIYCLDPPLDQVPKGNWKCKWCVKCVKCGTTAVPKGGGLGALTEWWKNNYTECALCFSLTQCHMCSRDYADSDLVGKCVKCERWAHVSCDGFADQHSNAYFNQQQFVCGECQQKHIEAATNGRRFDLQLIGSGSGGMMSNSQANSSSIATLNQSLSDTLVFLEELANLTSKKNGCLLDEGVFLTDVGAELLKRIKIKPQMISRQRNRGGGTLKSSGNVNQIIAEAEKNEKQIDENSQSSNEEKLESMNDEGFSSNKVQSIEALNNKNEGENEKRKRHINLGMGGFNLKLRSRSKVQFADNPENAANIENENRIAKQRKKKSQFEEMIPSYMQEAFFGSNVMTESSDYNFDESLPETKINEKKLVKDAQQHHHINLDENMFKLAQQNKKGHLELGIEDFLDGDIVSYLFNENRNLMEFNPEHDMSNKSRFKEGNYDEKIFDEKIYEDIFHQMVSDPTPQQSSSTSKSSVDEYLNLNSAQNMAETVNYGPNNTDRNKGKQVAKESTSNTQPAQPTTSTTATTTPSTTTPTPKVNEVKSAVGEEDIVGGDFVMSDDNRNIDNLARQFKESTHKFAQQHSVTQPPIPPMHHHHHHHHSHAHPQSMPPQSIPPQHQVHPPPPPIVAQHHHIHHEAPPQQAATMFINQPPPSQHQPHIHHHPQQPQQQIHHHPPPPLPLQQQHSHHLQPQPVPVQVPVQVHSQVPQPPPQPPPSQMAHPHHQIHQMMPIQIQQQQQQQQAPIYHDPHHHIQQQQQQIIKQTPQQQFAPTVQQVVVENKDQHQTSSAPQQQQQQQQIMSTTFMSAIPQISTGTQHLTTSTSQAANQQLEFKPSPNNVVDLNASLASSESKLGFDDQELSNDASGPAGQKPDGTKHQKMLEKYAEDEDLGDLATQAMSLYSNVNFPNLKTEIQDVAERYRYIHKIWRKLDSEVKLNYINKSRQNRYKKKSDDKPASSTTGTTSSSSSTTVAASLTAAAMARAKRARSPSSAASGEESGACFSRSITPSAMSVTDDTTNDASSSQHHLPITTTLTARLLNEDVNKQTKPGETTTTTISFLNTNESDNKIKTEFQPASLTVLNAQIQQQNQQQQQQQQKAQIQQQPQQNPIILYPMPMETAGNIKQQAQELTLVAANPQQNTTPSKQEKITIKSYLSLNNPNNSGASNSSGGIFQLTPKIQATTSGNGVPIDAATNQPKTVNISKLFIDQSGNCQIRLVNSAGTEPQAIQIVSAQGDEASDHIDSIINQVAAGSGTIPYNPETDENFEEDTSSSIKDFVNDQNDGTMSSETSNDKFGATTKKRQAPTNKIINQLILQSQDESGIKQIISGINPTTTTTTTMLTSDMIKQQQQTKKKKQKSDGDEKSTPEQSTPGISFIDISSLSSSTTTTTTTQKPPGSRNNSSPVKINELLMMNHQNYTTANQQQFININPNQSQVQQQQQPKPIQFIVNTSGGVEQKNFYVIQPSPPLQQQQQQIESQQQQTKIICKDDNLKKMLALPENDLLIENNAATTSSTATTSNIQQQTTRNLLIKSLIIQEGGNGENSSIKKLIQTQQQPSGGQNPDNKFFQLDGSADDPKEDSQHQHHHQTSATSSSSSSSTSASSKLATTKVVINHELLSSYGITLSPSPATFQQSQQFNSNDVDKAKKMANVIRYEAQSQQQDSSQVFIPVESPKPQQQNPPPSKSNVIKNLIINQQQQQQQQQQKQYQLINEASNPNNNTTAQIKMQPTEYYANSSGSTSVTTTPNNTIVYQTGTATTPGNGAPIVVPPPKVNGDNTLLKALLQTAPKNAVIEPIEKSNGAPTTTTPTTPTAATTAATIAIPTSNGTIAYAIKTEQQPQTPQIIGNLVPAVQQQSQIPQTTTAQPQILTEAASITQQQQQQQVNITSGTGNAPSTATSTTTTKKSSNTQKQNRQQNKLMNDLKNKIMESNQTSETSMKINTILEQAAAAKRASESIATNDPMSTKLSQPQSQSQPQPPQSQPQQANKKQRKNIKLLMDGSSSSSSLMLAGDSTATAVEYRHQQESNRRARFIDELGRLGAFNLTQPVMNLFAGLDSIEYPEREHAGVVRKCAKTTLQVDESPIGLFDLSVRLRQVSASTPPQPHTALNLLEWAHSSNKLGYYVFRPTADEISSASFEFRFRICSARTQTPSLPIASNDDSRKRLNNILQGENSVEAMEEESTTESASIKTEPESSSETKEVIQEYFKKPDSKYVEVQSPLIDIEMTDTAIIPPSPPPPQPVDQCDEKIKTVFKLSKKSSADLQATLKKLSEFLAIDSSNIDLASKLAVASKPPRPIADSTAFAQKSVNSATTTTIRPAMNETSYTLSHLAYQSANYICRFCESLISACEHEELEIDLNNKENNNSANTNRIIRFCSPYCKNSYKKVLLMRRSNLKVAVQANSKLSLMMDMSAATTAAATNPASTTPNQQQQPTSNDPNQQNKRLSGGGNENSETSNLIRWNSALAAALTKSTKLEATTAAVANCELKPHFDILRTSAGKTADQRVCIFCQTSGDQDSNGPSRLLSIDVDKWAHLNCALWSDGVYETMNGSLVNVDIAYKKCANVLCSLCHKKGASLKCFALKCNVTYHLQCAIKDKCVFNQDKTVYCANHWIKTAVDNRLTDLSVFRNVWIQRDEVAQIQSFMLRDIDENHYAIRIGSLFLHSIGQLLPHQLSSGFFNNRDYIYPVGYKATRFYWSMKNCFKRARYECSIDEKEGKPEFSVSILEDTDDSTTAMETDAAEQRVDQVVTMTDTSPSNLWKKILERLENMRKENNVMKIFPEYLSGEYLFGMSEPHIVRLIESLPGVETLTNYAFKYGRLQLLDMPLTINPTGCARSEPKLRTHFRKSHHQIQSASSSSSGSSSQQVSRGGATSLTASSSSSAMFNEGSSAADDYYNDYSDDMSNHDLDDYYSNMESSNAAPSVSYHKQFSLSKSTQFKKLKAEWRQNVYLAKSQIQGLGLYAARDLEKNTMIIEYIGELIRNEVANRREKLYESQNRGIYMFRLNDDQVVDATITGGLARYINHCCDPNCIAETVTLEKDQRIIIIANKKILKGEELTYDYKFEFEDESNKIQCLCGSANCKKWMN